MDRQKIFDTILAHSRTQKKQALSVYGTCQYRNENGEKCFLGALIPDEMYEEHGEVMEGASIKHSELEPLRNLLQVQNADDENFLNRLQGIHDCTDPEFWEEHFQTFAKTFDYAVVYTAPEKKEEVSNG